ncbi:hypothetical protein AB1Y20_003631 [Prymnesium parvum]|uniref:WW domain-containing protein n=1 Tax=Prymnesium parvum TaxID=97485 RepID=A0AB34J551_PRYPA
MSDRPLPPNWRMARDSDGKAYYFNELTGETSWQFPSAPAAPVQAMVTADDVDDKDMNHLSSGDVVPHQMGGSDMSAPSTMVGVGGTSGGGGGRRSLSAVLTAEGYPKLLLLLFSSVVLLIQAWIHSSQRAGDASLAYALSVSIVSLSVTAFFLLYARFKPDDLLTRTVKARGSSYTIPQLYALFMSIWWAFGAFILTFYQPYSVPSNAYVACWLGFVSAVLYTASVFSRVENVFRSFSEVSLTPSLTALSGCVVASAVVFFVSLGYLNFWTGLFALITSILSFVIAALTYFCIDTKRFGPVQCKVSASFLVMIWALSIFFLTFDLDIEKDQATVDVSLDQGQTASANVRFFIDEHMTAFTHGGNGFIATWAGMLCSFAFAYHEFVGIELNMQRTLRQSFSLRQHDGPHAEV